MLNGKRIIAVLPAYNAGETLKRTVDELDRAVVDEVLLVDDASTDDTMDQAARLGLTSLRHDKNRGYGANQKSCYKAALALGADIVVMVHPDYQYSPQLVPAMAAMIAYGEYDFVLGSRILAQHSVARGMPRYKFVANRILTLLENLVLRQKLSEYHTGLRAYSRSLLEVLPFERNSDDFVFDNQIIAQAVAAGARIGELSCPTRYEADSSSIGLARSVRYGLGVLRTTGQYRLHASGVRRYPYLETRRPESRPPADLDSMAAPVDPGLKALCGEAVAPACQPMARSWGSRFGRRPVKDKRVIQGALRAGRAGSPTSNTGPGS